MKAQLVPIYFKNSKNEEFDLQVSTLRGLLEDEAVILDAVELGDEIPAADAVIFPVLIGEAYKQIDKIMKIELPIVALTSEFGTVAMWDWEIITYMKSKGLKPFAPYSIELTKIICRTLALKRELKDTKFLVFQDNPGDGMQAEIFKRFYWWEDECTRDIEENFGVKIVKKSFKKLGEDAKAIADQEAEAAINNWDINCGCTSKKSLLSAAKIYVAIKRELDQDKSIRGVGINCLNESFYSDTTPCLAWNMLYEQEGIMWVCEGDTLSLLTKYIVNKALKTDIMMSNLYPFLMGMAALKHEKIDKFPDVNQPENCILMAHCGYMGLSCQSQSKSWEIVPKVLAIVDENAIAVNSTLPEGPITLTKLHSTFKKLLIVDGQLEGYAQYPGSDCRNGAIIRVADGHQIMDNLYSHHCCVINGNKAIELEIMSRVFELKTEKY